MNHEFLFKIEVKAAFSSHLEPWFKVSKVCYDACIIAKFKESPANSQSVTIKTDLQYSTIMDEFLNANPRMSIELLEDCTTVSCDSFIFIVFIELINQLMKLDAILCGVKIILFPVIKKGWHLCGTSHCEGY